MSDREIKNAKIVSTMLGREDHGIFTMYVTLDYGGSGQTFGGYSYDEYDPKAKRRVFTPKAGQYSMRFIDAVMRAAGVDRYEALPGTYVRVDASYDKVHRIGHLLRDDAWFSPDGLIELTEMEA